MKRLIELAVCLKWLGLKTGWRYWRIQARARKDPSIVLQWARDCRLVGLQDWAEQLEVAHEKWLTLESTDTSLHSPPQESPARIDR